MEMSFGNRINILIKTFRYTEDVEKTKLSYFTLMKSTSKIEFKCPFEIKQSGFVIIFVAFRLGWVFHQLITEN
jgi:hypothetical protein